MKFHDLVLLLDNRSERYDEVAVFARHLDPEDVVDCVWGRSCRIAGSSGSFSFGFAYGNVWRELRIEEKLGIVVLSSPELPEGGYAPEVGSDALRSALQAAAAVLADELVPYAVRQEHFALLRKQEGVLHRNMLMEWREIAGAPPSSSGKWMTVSPEHSAKLFLAWVKRSLWADVPTPDLSKREMDLGLHCPFPGADAHPEKRGGELCVEGTDVPVARILAELTERGVDAEPTCGRISKFLDLDYDTVRKCLRGLADWLKAQNWIYVPLARNRYDDGPGDVTSEDCAKLEGICNETPESRPLGPPAVPSQSNIDIAQAKIQQAKERNSYRALIEQALAVCVMRGASSAMSQDVARAILWLDRQPSPGAEGGFRCPRCNTDFLASDHDKEGRPCVRGGHVVCPKCARAWRTDTPAAPVEKRCGTCFFGDEMRCPCVPVDVHSELGGIRPTDDGPPWDNCRYWQPKGGK